MFVYTFNGTFCCFKTKLQFLEDIKASIIKALSPAVPVPSLQPIDSPFPLGSSPIPPLPGIPANQPIGKGGCPLCDRSVYSYCYDKMIHDACCCNNGNLIHIYQFSS